MRLVEVVWLDSVLLDPGWADVEDVLSAVGDSLLEQRSCGHLVADTDCALVLALHRSADGARVAATSVIPKRAVVAVRDLG